MSATVQIVPHHTEARIRELCDQAVAAKSKAEIERIIPELQAALHEHIQLAKVSLEGQTTTMMLLPPAA